MSTTESSTPDRPKSTPTTRRSKASSTEAAAPAAAPAPAAEPAPLPAPPAPPEPEPEPELDLSFLPRFVRNLGGFKAAATAMEAARVAANLPSLSLIDYRFVLKRPGGNPFGVPVEVIYKPGGPDEINLGTFRVTRR